MHETPEDRAALQEPIDRSYAEAGAHLLRIHSPERMFTFRMWSRVCQLGERLQRRREVGAGDRADAR